MESGLVQVPDRRDRPALLGLETRDLGAQCGTYGDMAAPIAHRKETT